MSENVVYQGEEEIPAGTRMTMGRLRRMLRAVDESSLTKRHKAIIKSGIVQYADGDGFWFADQREWADVAGCDVKLITAALSQAHAVGLLRKASRVYTTNGRVGTSLYVLSARLWSSDPEAAKAGVEARLRTLTIKPARAPKTVDCPCTENGAAERDVLLRSSPPSLNREVGESVFEDESDSLATDLGVLATLKAQEGQNLPPGGAGWPRPGRVSKDGKHTNIFLEHEGVARLFQDCGWLVDYRWSDNTPLVWTDPIPGRRLVAA